MLAFDIETKGLNRKLHDVTIVCTQDYASGARTAYEFERCRREGGDVERLVAEMTAAFDAATSLCAFNGVRFDIPFLESLAVPNIKLVQWALKCTDYLEQFRLRAMPTCGLNVLAGANGVELKSSDGKAAIRMAENGAWDELREYCAQDVAILCDLQARRFLKHPRSLQIVDLRHFSHADVYAPHDSTAAQPVEDRRDVDLPNEKSEQTHAHETRTDG